jgi:hypothetical protein
VCKTLHQTHLHCAYVKAVWRILANFHQAGPSARICACVRGHVCKMLRQTHLHCMCMLRLSGASSPTSVKQGQVPECVCVCVCAWACVQKAAPYSSACVYVPAAWRILTDYREAGPSARIYMCEYVCKKLHQTHLHCVYVQAAWRILADYREAGPSARIYGGVPEKRSPLVVIFQPCNLLAQVFRFSERVSMLCSAYLHVHIFCLYEFPFSCRLSAMQSSISGIPLF